VFLKGCISTLTLLKGKEEVKEKVLNRIIQSRKSQASSLVHEMIHQGMHPLKMSGSHVRQ